jgi:cytochrome c oxidase subunit 3
MAGARAPELTISEWDGGALPYAISSNKLGMWLFILSDSLTFAALLVGYSYVRIATPNWPKPFHFSPSIIYSSVMTFSLLSSSLTMALAVRAAHLGRRSSAVKFIWLTILFGATFIILHANEWHHLITGEGVHMFSNPWGVPLFGATFFTITGLHMFHVTSGLVYLAVIAIGHSSGKYDSEDVEISGLYWHFVDLVWMFVFPMIYLLSIPLEHH